MKTSRGFLRVLFLAAGIFLLASSGMAKSVQSQADDLAQVRLPIMLKRFAFGFGTVTGNVINASLHGNVDGARICWGIQCTVSNADGGYELEQVASGPQALTASAAGFYTATQVTNVVGNMVNNQDILIVPDVQVSGLKYRIVTTWDETSCWPDPNGVDCWYNDLDAHLWIEPEPITYHIGYYFHQHGEDGPYEDWLDTGDCVGMWPNACLERDTYEGSGPETIAIKELALTKTYSFGVRNYNQDRPGVPPISQTGAKVQLYGLTGLIETFEVPTDMGGKGFWYVFMLDNTVDPPVLVTKNCIIDYTDNPPVCP